MDSNQSDKALNKLAITEDRIGQPYLIQDERCRMHCGTVYAEYHSSGAIVRGPWLIWADTYGSVYGGAGYNGAVGTRIAQIGGLEILATTTEVNFLPGNRAIEMNRQISEAWEFMTQLTYDL
jgi:hypothetical protein